VFGWILLIFFFFFFKWAFRVLAFSAMAKIVNTMMDKGKAAGNNGGE
jgi:hypothetical protein